MIYPQTEILSKESSRKKLCDFWHSSLQMFPSTPQPHDNYVLCSIYWIGLCFQTQARWCPSCCLHPIYSGHPEVKLSCLPEPDSWRLFPPYSQPSEPCCWLLLPPPPKTSGQWSTRGRRLTVFCEFLSNGTSVVLKNFRSISHIRC